MAKEYTCRVYLRLIDPLMAGNFDIDQFFEGLSALLPALSTDCLLAADGFTTENGVTLEFVLTDEGEAEAAMLALSLANEVIEVVERTANVRFQPIEEPSIDVQLKVRATAGSGR